jgi:hypothetical protein
MPEQDTGSPTDRDLRDEWASLQGAEERQSGRFAAEKPLPDQAAPGAPAVDAGAAPGNRPGDTHGLTTGAADEEDVSGEA